ncbi:MAG: hypothetical protein R3D58_12890 [Saprospiraceae bacterium]
MRRVIASFFILIYLFGSTELHELGKISAFVSHYAEHKRGDANLNLFDFVKIHYFNGNVIDDDYAKDMQLPFKTADCSLSAASHILPLPVALDPPAFDAFDSGKLPRYDQSMLPAAHTADIWQPPKAC